MTERVFPALACLLLCACARSTAPPEVSAFLGRVQAYATLHNRAERSLAPLAPGAGPAQIEERRQALAEAIRRERSTARPGDLFGGARGVVLEVVRSEMTGESARRAVMKENEERESKVEVRVNGEYPAAAPLSMVPPAMLARLPALPVPLEYRFVGRSLILLDASARLIADVLENAVP